MVGSASRASARRRRQRLVLSKSAGLARFWDAWSMPETMGSNAAGVAVLTSVLDHIAQGRPDGD
jgi:hypothetical protein